jgi:uncharacterized membrane protein
MGRIHDFRQMRETACSPHDGCMVEPTVGPSIAQESLMHTANVLIHVVAGTLALILGFVQMAMQKGGSDHVTRGLLFVRAVWIVVATAALGLLVFRFVAFLGVITLLVAYWAYSGQRALRLRNAGPRAQDAMASGAGLLAAGLFVVFLKRATFPWAPIVIYSTLGTLALVCLYDLARFAFPTRWYQGRLWLYEHIVKMLGAHSALGAAFSGTVLVALQPYSQIAPSVLWTMAMIGSVIYYSRRGQGFRTTA